LATENENLRDELEEALEIKRNLENGLEKSNQTISELEQAQNQLGNGVY